MHTYIYIYIYIYIYTYIDIYIYNLHLTLHILPGCELRRNNLAGMGLLKFHFSEAATSSSFEVIISQEWDCWVPPRGIQHRRGDIHVACLPAEFSTEGGDIHVACLPSSSFLKPLLSQTNFFLSYLFAFLRSLQITSISAVERHASGMHYLPSIVSVRLWFHGIAFDSEWAYRLIAVAPAGPSANSKLHLSSPHRGGFFGRQ